jgi:hypothetical protein
MNLAVTQVLDRIGDKWTVIVVGALAKGSMRFNVMLLLIGGVSHRMLTPHIAGPAARRSRQTADLCDNTSAGGI